MPEAAMNEDAESIAWENDVGCAGKTLYVQSETKAPGVEVFAQQDFGAGILAPDA